MAAGEDPVEGSPFLRDLTSSDVPTRREAFGTLRLYLQRSTSFDTLELLKLWKGLFYCMWMTANPKPQQRLAQEFASLVTDTIPKQNVLPFIDAFWQTIARQWSSIDSQRVDKYLRLMRFILRASFERLARYQYEESLCEEHNAVMKRTPLNVDNAQVPNGMRYHVLDVYVDELATAQGLTSNLTTPVIERLLEPVHDLHIRNKDKAVRNRASETLRDERLAEWGVQPAMQKGLHNNSSFEDDEFEGFGD